MVELLILTVFTCLVRGAIVVGVGGVLDALRVDTHGVEISTVLVLGLDCQFSMALSKATFAVLGVVF